MTAREAELESALKAARVAMIQVADNKKYGRSWDISYPLTVAAAKIASVLDNTEESRDE